MGLGLWRRGCLGVSRVYQTLRTQDTHYQFSIKTLLSKTSDSAGAAVSSTSSWVKCEVCDESWEKSKIWQHIGVHIPQENRKRWSTKKRPRYPCGLCALRGALGCDPKNAKHEPASGGYIWIDQSGKKAMHECKLLGSVSYIIATTSKCLLAMPCTNRPFKYNMPDCNMWVWTYSINTHSVQYKDSLRLRRQARRWQNVCRREESGVVETSRAHICASISESIYQGYQNYVSHLEEKQRANMHMYIGVWLEVGCSGCKGDWAQSHVVTSGCPGFLGANFFLKLKKQKLLYLFSLLLGFSYSLSRSCVLSRP